MSKVHIMCILDRSGSMSSLATEVIGSFNNFIETQKKEKGEADLTLVLFDDKYEVIYDKININDVKPIDNSIYFPRGMTGLLDAVGKTIAFNNDENAVVLIQTDGYENASQEYNYNSVKKLIDEKEEKGWEFIFLGANIDANQMGSSFGMKAGKSIQYDASVDGVQFAFNSMSNVTASYRASKLDSFSKS